MNRPAQHPTPNFQQPTANSRRRGKAGLTLIETLMAIAVLGIGLSILVSSAGRALGVVKRTRHFETARHLFDIVELENPILEIEEMVDQVESGGFEPPNDAYTWTRAVEPMFNFEEEETGFYVIRTRIQWSERGQESYEEIVTGVFAGTEQEGVVPDGEAMDAETGAGGGVAAAGGVRSAAPTGRNAGGGPGGGRGGDAMRGMRGGDGGGFPGMPGGRGGDGGAGPRGGRGDGGTGNRGSGRSGAGRAFSGGGGGGRQGSGGGIPGGGGGGGGGPPAPPGFR